MESAFLCLMIYVTVAIVNMNTIDAAGLSSSCTGPGNCSSIAHATCIMKTCQCNTTYKAAQGKCILKVIDLPCTNATESTVCTLEHSRCNAKKCACKAGYTNIDDTCLKTLGTPCGSTNMSTVCTPGVPNSACPSGKCECAATFVEENGMCPKAAGQNCTKVSECGLNASCDQAGSPCKCKDGFVAAKGLCTKQSSAVSFKIAWSTVGILMMLNTILKML